MFDRLIDVLIDMAQWFVPWHVVDAYEEGLVLRLGKFHRHLAPGFHWIIPFGVENVLSDNVVPRTTNLGSQSLTTLDGKTVVVGAILTSSIRDVRKALLEVEGVDHVLKDSCYGAVATLVSGSAFESLRTEAFAEELTKACRKGAWRYGIEIHKVQLSDNTLTRVHSHHINGLLPKPNEA